MQDTRRGLSAPLSAVFILATLFLSGGKATAAQDNYQLQVFESKTLTPQTTLVELHNVLIGDGTKALNGTEFAPNGLYYTNDTLHETVEIRQGITDWAEVGFYVLTSAQSGKGWDWVGDRIRPQVRAPESWHLPVGASLSVEFGYQRPYYATDMWTLEITPIIDKQLGQWYFAVNPAFVRSFRGQNASRGFAFAPSAKFSYEISRYVSAGAEYYANYGPVSDIEAFRFQQQEFFPTLDLNLSSDWDLSFGVGIGVTTSTDDWIYKANIGRRFDWKRRREENSVR